ncbi:MAG: hypothetical protein ACMUHY_06925 [Thermoplasmatota archaeon]
MRSKLAKYGAFLVVVIALVAVLSMVLVLLIRRRNEGYAQQGPPVLPMVGRGPIPPAGLPPSRQPPPLGPPGEGRALSPKGASDLPAEKQTGT